MIETKDNVENSKKRMNSIFKINFEKIIGTGFFCKFNLDENLEMIGLFTNYHVLPEI